AAVELNTHQGAALIYSDEDRIDARGALSKPKFKPDWNPDLFTAYNYPGHLCFYRTELVRSAGGLRTDYEGSEEWDLSLRIIERVPAENIRHIPFILYHSHAGIGVEDRETGKKARKALADHFKRRDLAVAITPVAGGFRLRYPLPAQPPL